MTNKLSTVHDALSKSVLSDDSDAMIQGSFRVNKSIKEQAELICKEGGTTLSSFIRSCLNVLIEDYNSAPEVDSDESE